MTHHKHDKLFSLSDLTDLDDEKTPPEEEITKTTIATPI